MTSKDEPMAAVSTFGQLLITGILQGGVYVLISIGLTLIFGVMGVINFAHADFLMLGMYISLFTFLAFGISPVFIFFLVLPAFFLLGVVLERLLIEPIIDRSEESQLILTFGLLLVIQNLALGFWGPNPQQLRAGLFNGVIKLGPFILDKGKSISFVFAAAATIAVFLLLKTQYGRVIRATAEDVTLARYTGIDVTKVRMAVFGLGIALTASAGTMLVTYFPVSPRIGFTFLIIMFVVVVLGGLGSVRGAAIAGFAIGIVEQLSTVWIPLELQESVVFVLFLLIIFVRPDGLFGGGREVNL